MAAGFALVKQYIINTVKKVEKFYQEDKHV